MGKRIAKNKLAVTEHRKNFISLIDKLAYRNSRWNVFNDFLEVAAVSFSNSDVRLLATNKDTWEEREKLTTRTLSKYTYEEQQYFPEFEKPRDTEKSKSITENIVSKQISLF